LTRPDISIGNNHRASFDIIADILDASCSGAKKTNLMYRCNLSFKQLKSYSNMLLRNGLLRVNGQTDESDPAIFQATDKGRQFLRAYKGLKALIE